MNNKRYWILIATLAVFALVIHLFSYNSIRVEHYYSTGIYPYIAAALRHLFGWLPFSIGDILYGSIILFLLFKMGKAIKRIVQRQRWPRSFLTRLQSSLVVILLVYVLFNALWGINYNRKGIAGQLNLSMEKYSLDELKTLNGVLLQKVNASNSRLTKQPPPSMSSKEIFLRAQAAYGNVFKEYAFLNYYPGSIKSSLWGWLGNYVGFMGYYNPFTGEGQVNTNIPRFLQPYTNCHEIAHQLGYAKENEANFVGYLAAAASRDEVFHYSVYLELFLYANRNLYQTDSLAATGYIKALNPPVKQDLREWQRFNLSYKNPVEPLIRWMYGIYLENNQQPSGVLSYDEVTAFLIAYYKKYGKV